MSDLTVLIISTEPVIGALLTLYVEANRYRAVLARGGRATSRRAVARSGATVILVDVDHRDGYSPAFVAQQQASGRQVIAFSPKMGPPELEQRVAHLHVPWFTLPLKSEQFGTVLAEARRGLTPDAG